MIVNDRAIASGGDPQHYNHQHGHEQPPPQVEPGTFQGAATYPPQTAEQLAAPPTDVGGPLPPGYQVPGHQTMTCNAVPMPGAADHPPPGYYAPVAGKSLPMPGAAEPPPPGYYAPVAGNSALPPGAAAPPQLGYYAPGYQTVPGNFAPPPGAANPPPPNYYAPGSQTVNGYAVNEGTQAPTGEDKLPCCGCGIGWFLFIIGFFLAGIPWYCGAIIYLCVRTVDHREKPGYIACTVAAVLATVVSVIEGVTRS